MAQPTSRTPVPIEEPADSVARRTFIVLSVATGFGLLLLFLYEIRSILILLFISVVFTLALDPAVTWLGRKGLGRIWAALLSVTVSLVVIGGILTAVAAPLVSETSRLAENAPRIVEDISRNEQIKKIEERYHIEERVREAAEKAPEFLTGSQSAVVNTIRRTFGALANVAIIITVTFFLLLEGPSAWRFLLSTQKARTAKRFDRLGQDVSRAVNGYVSGNLLISLIAGTVAFVTLSILGVPYAFPLAVLVAVFDLIPLIGATIANIILVLVALTVGVPAAIIIGVVMLVYQGIEGHVLQPVIYAKTVSLSPLFVLVATITGAHLGGIVGVLLAIPVASIVQIVLLDIIQGTRAGKRASLKAAR